MVKLFPVNNSVLRGPALVEPKLRSSARLWSGKNCEKSKTNRTAESEISAKWL